VAASAALAPVVIALASTPSASGASAPAREKTRKAKIGLLNALKSAPDLVIVGGSRAQRLSPAQ